MAFRMRFFSFIILFFIFASIGFTDDHSLQFFMRKIPSMPKELSKQERTELLNRIEEAMGQAQKIYMRLSKDIQSGEMDIQYQEGRFWMSKLEEDKGSVETGMQQLRLLREKPTHLVASIKLYKSLRDLSANLNAYNNHSSFSSFVGDLAPEMGLWADPVFYQLYLLPLAQSKNIDTQPLAKEKKPVPKVKKPQG
jgi:hypothetical protein